MAWHRESRRHSLARKGIKTAQKIPKKTRFEQLASKPNIHITKLEKSGDITNEEARTLRSLNWVFHRSQKLWSVGYGETKFVMNQLDLSRKKADKLIMKVLNELDKE